MDKSKANTYKQKQHTGSSRKDASDVVLFEWGHLVHFSDKCRQQSFVTNYDVSGGRWKRQPRCEGVYETLIYNGA